jgi:Tol biopolymer transport system component
MSDSHDRWRRVEQICQDALDRPRAERAAFLDTACGPDVRVRGEVDALLAQEEAGEPFLESPIGAVAAGAMEPRPARLSGQRIGVFDVDVLLGAGGMGEVYRARDTRLDRDVAIKILPAAVASDAERVARFRREAKTLAALNHPHIATIYGLEESAGVTILVMELVEGDDLSLRIARGAMPMDEALPIATQIAEALAAAHEHGIVHRDLKPANIKVRHDGVVKVLDFGLAKAMETAGAQSPLSAAPTITTPAMTAAGVILGTAAYMAPEQARGRPVDKRADVWAFGAVLFEMLTGRRAFDGEDVAQMLGAVLRLEPDWGTIPHDVPPPVRTLLQQCLVKEPRERVADIAAALFVLRHQTSGTAPAAPPTASNRRPWRLAAVTIGAALAMATIAFWASDYGRPAPEPLEFTIAPPEGTTFGGRPAGGTGTGTQLAVSPDGRYVVFVARAKSELQLWLRSVASADARPLQGTDGSTFPFWSPDSRFIAFFAGGALKKVSVAGGPPVTLAEAPIGLGGSWSRDDEIVYHRVTGSGLVRIPSAGGVPTPVTTIAEGEDGHRWPHFLPDGRHFFYTAITGACCPPAKPGVVKIGSLDGGDPVALLQADSAAAYASGHVLFARGQTLMAQPFDPTTRKTTGDAFPLRERIGTEGSRYTSASASNNGTLAYAPNSAPTLQVLTWFDRTGRSLGTLGDGAIDAAPALSPDERHVALALQTGNPINLDIWLIDVHRNLRSRLTSDLRPEGSPVWAPDGTRIAFGSGPGMPEKALLLQTSVSGNAASETLFEAGTPARPCGLRQCRVTPTDWSADGRFLLFTLFGSFPATSDIWALPLFGDRTPLPVVNTPFREGLGVFSPDSRWVAYTSDDAGQLDVYVQPFGRAGGKHRISVNGGRNPHWRADGKELFYLDADGAMTAVSITTTDTVVVGKPETLFSVGTLSANQMFSVTKDGQRFLVNARPPNTTGTSPMTVVVNWPSTLQK